MKMYKYMKPKVLKPVISALFLGGKLALAGSCMRVDFGDGDIFEGLEYKRAKAKCLTE
jgi:hypothetical protein